MCERARFDASRAPREASEDPGTDLRRVCPIVKNRDSCDPRGRTLVGTDASSSRLAYGRCTRDALQRTDVRAALPWLATAASVGLFATAAMPVDGWSTVIPVLAVVAATWVVGIAGLVRAAVQGAHPGVVVLLALAPPVVAAAAALVTFAAFLTAILPLAAPILVSVAVLLALLLTGRGVPPHRPAQPAAVAIGACVSLGLVALGIIDGLVWMPETLVPSMSAIEIHGALVEQGGAGMLTFVVAFGALWAGTTLVVAAIVLWRRLRPGPTLAWTLAPGALALAGLPMWEFGIGMVISDSLPPFRGGPSEAWPWLAALGCVVVGVATHGVLRRPADAPAAEAVVA